MAKYFLPYHFTPIAKAPRIALAKPIPHDEPIGFPKQEKSAKGLLTGEVRCSLFALTPLFVGNQRTEREPDHHALVSPLTLGGKTAISKHALKGMLSSALSAMMGEKLSRVGERGFLFRPLNCPERSRVSGIRWRLGVLRGARGHAAEIHAIELLREGKRELFCEALKQLSSLPSALGPLPMRLGIDGSLMLHEAHLRANSTIENGPKSKSKKLVSTWWVYYRKSQHSTDPLQVHDQAMRQYGGTIELLRSRMKKHPTLQRHLDEVKAEKKISDNTLLAWFDEQWNLERSKLIYFEYRKRKSGRGNELISFGPCFRYPWAYGNSVRMKGGNLRTEIGFETQEEEWFLDPLAMKSALSLTKRLFGVSPSDDTLLRNHASLGQQTLGSANAAAKKRRQLRAFRGKVRFTHAIYETGGWERTNVTLKTLGQPKASSWETYLQHNGIQIATWGMDGMEPVDAGDLGGRKRYLHNPKAARDDHQFTQENQDRQNCTIQSGFWGPKFPASGATSIPDSLPQFRFTLRFDGLAPWELGALLAALELGNELLPGNGLPQVIAQRGFAPDDQQQRSPLHAHKLGLGRPLGLGSVVCVAQSVQIVTRAPMQLNGVGFATIQQQEYTEEDQRKCILEFYSKLEGREISTCTLPPSLVAFERITRFVDRGIVDYPKSDLSHGTAAKKPGEPVLQYHTDAKLAYLKFRRLGVGSDRLRSAVLRPAGENTDLTPIEPLQPKRKE